MKINRLIIAAFAAFATVAASAQQTGPYTKFGYGNLSDNATAAQRQMGGIGYAMNSGRQINVKNPASYAFIDSLTFLFDMGIDFTIRQSSQAATDQYEAAKERKEGGGLDYITMQVPIGKRFGASFGVLPYSSVGYSFGTKIDNGVNSREGTGGLNQLYLGFAGKIIDGLSVGFNASYLWGNIIHDNYVTTASGSQSLFERLTEVRDWHIEIGAQYSYRLNPSNLFTLGVVYSPKKTLLGHAEVTQYDVNADTEPKSEERVNLKGNADLAETWGAGINWEWRNRLMVEADFTYQPWKNAKFAKSEYFEAYKFADRYQGSFGAAYTHSHRGNYLQRMTWRVGGFYNRDYIMVGDNNVKEYGLSCGFGLPTLAGKTIINLGFEYRHRQATPQALIKENFFNIRLGINFNELWFFKNKLN